MQTWDVVDTLIAQMQKISMINPWNDIFAKSKMLHCYHDSNAVHMTLVT
jgi:hypothetical protein